MSTITCKFEQHLECHGWHVLCDLYNKQCNRNNCIVFVPECNMEMKSEDCVYSKHNGLCSSNIIITHCKLKHGCKFCSEFKNK